MNQMSTLQAPNPEPLIASTQNLVPRLLKTEPGHMSCSLNSVKGVIQGESTGFRVSGVLNSKGVVWGII